MGVEDLIGQRRVLVLLGAGGVGKTSCSIGLAVAAARLGKRVGLLSIDPARRLAAALGIPLGHELATIDLTAAQALPGGSLKAAMLDQKAVFDAMVTRHAPSPEVAAKILQNRLYRAASTKLAGAMEYMALARLQELIDDNAYDLIVLDTPPDSHALDFLARPNILAGFMENRVMSWLIKPFHMASRLGVERLFSVGERLMGGLAKVTGFQALRLFSEFLVLMQQVIEGFHASGEKILTTLQSPQTAFLMVTVGHQAALRSARKLSAQLNELGYPFDGVVFNRCLPPEVAASLATLAKHAGPLPPNIKHLLSRWRAETDLPAQFLAQVRAGEGRTPLVLRVSEHDDLQTQAGIFGFSQAFLSHPKPVQVLTASPV